MKQEYIPNHCIFLPFITRQPQEKLIDDAKDQPDRTAQIYAASLMAI